MRSQIGYRLPLVTKFDDLDRLQSVTTLLLVTIGYYPDLHPPVTSYHRLPAYPMLAGYRYPAVTKNQNFAGYRVTAPANPWFIPNFDKFHMILRFPKEAHSRAVNVPQV